MSLVPYAGSDISDSEEENDESKSEPNHQVEEIVKSNNLLNSLPEPKYLNDIGVPEADDEFLQKKSSENIKKPVKILVSVLKNDEDLEEEEAPLKKFRSSNSKGTGLFSILPAPKNTIKSTQLIPQSISKNQATNSPAINKNHEIKKIPDKYLKNKSTVNQIFPKNDQTKESIDEIIDNDEQVIKNDFFSLEEKDEIDLEEYSTNEILPEIEYSNKTNNLKSAEQNILDNEIVKQPEQNELSSTIQQEEIADLDEEAFKKLCGARALKRGENVRQILNINESDVRPDRQEWMKQVLIENTSETTSHRISENSGPGGIYKRKHQITYLAHQAKMNEQQLKNVWAQNRATRQQTQSKYGF